MQQEQGATAVRELGGTVDRTPERPSPGPRLADPGAWAVTAFATTSFMLGMYNANLIDKQGVGIVIPVALFFGGLIQIMVGVLEVIRMNLFGAVVFGTYGPFWVIYGMIETIYARFVPASSLDGALALFLAMFAVLTFYFAIASLRTEAVLVGVLALIFIGLVLLAIGAGAKQPVFTQAAAG